jgi:hypothetical protein
MTVAVKQLLKSFDALSDEERQSAAAELLRKTLQEVPPDLSEDALVAAAEELFLELDAREAQDGQT